MSRNGSGLDFLSELRQHKAPELPVVVLSAYGEIEDAVAAMKLRASGYLKKPLDLDELLITLDKVLGTLNSPARWSIHAPGNTMPARRYVYWDSIRRS